MAQRRQESGHFSDRLSRAHRPPDAAAWAFLQVVGGGLQAQAWTFAVSYPPVPGLQEGARRAHSVGPGGPSFLEVPLPQAQTQSPWPGRGPRPHFREAVSRAAGTRELTSSKVTPASKASHPGQLLGRASPGVGWRALSGWAELLGNHYGMETGEALVSWAQMGHENKGLSHGGEHCLPRGSLSSRRTPPWELSLVTTQSQTGSSYFIFTSSRFSKRIKVQTRFISH